MSRSIVLEVEYPYPPARVWRALTDRDALADWLMPNNFEPLPGHRFEFRARPPHRGWRGFVECEVLEIDEPRALSYSWVGDPTHPPTTVTWTLTPTANGTRLRLEHAGFRGFKGWFDTWILGSGWKKMLTRALPKVLAELGAVRKNSGPGA